MSYVISRLHARTSLPLSTYADGKILTNEIELQVQGVPGSTLQANILPLVISGYLGSVLHFSFSISNASCLPPCITHLQYILLALYWTSAWTLKKLNCLFWTRYSENCHFLYQIFDRPSLHLFLID